MGNLTKTLLEATKAAFERDARVHKAPVTKKEMKAREEQRSTPVLTHHLQPDGSIQQEVNTQVEAENEQRIGFIRKRLERMNSIAKRDFNHSR